MSLGTIKLTNGSNTVVGTGTTFTTDLKSGDVISTMIGGVPYTLFVDTVTSNTAATLIDAFTGPTTSGVAYVAVPQQTLNRISASLASQTSEAVRRILQENANWQAFYSGSGDVTVTLADGTPGGRQVSGPSWAKLSQMGGNPWQNRGPLSSGANINQLNPATAFGEYGKSSNTGLTEANGFPPGAQQGVLKIVGGGFYGGTQIYTDRLGNEWVRTLTAAWNGTDGPWSNWINIATRSMRSTLLNGGNTDLNSYTTSDYYGCYRISGNSAATIANGWPYDGFGGFLEVSQGYGSSTDVACQHFAITATGGMYVRYYNGTTWSAWVESGYTTKPYFSTGDLNLLTDAGVYNISYTAATSLNAPVAIGGVLRVTQRGNSASTVLQEFFSVVGSGSQANRKFSRSLAGGVWTAWDEDVSFDQLRAQFGMGAGLTKSSFDWMNDDLTVGMAFSVSGVNISNTPGGITINTATGYVIRIVGGSGSGATTNRTIDISPNTTNDTVFQRYEVRAVGLAGSRTFNIRQIWTSADVVPLANGGTGSTSQAAARDNLGLKGAAVLDVGTAAGTVAAGNDSRLGTVNGKTGGTVTSGVNITGDLGVQTVTCVNLKATAPYSPSVQGLHIGWNLRGLGEASLSCNRGLGSGAFDFRIINKENTIELTRFILADTGIGYAPGGWQTGSDAALKENIKAVDDALPAVLSMTGVTWDYRLKAGQEKKTPGVGLIAQQVEKFCPDAVSTLEGTIQFDDGSEIARAKSLDVAGVSAAFHNEAIKSLFTLVKLALDDPDAARARIAAIESQSQAMALPLNALESGETLKAAPYKVTDSEGSASGTSLQSQ